MSYAKVSVIILNWNGKDDTLECLESVSELDYPNFEVIIVDNGSQDDSVSAIRNNFPGAIVLETRENLGFAGGNNVGMRYALQNGAEYILLLNNDTVVDKQLIRSLLDALTFVKEGGIFGAKIYYYGERNKIWFAGAAWIDRISGFDHVGQNSIDREERCGSIIETDYACGCALFASADILGKTGLFDERFFLTFEETDLCYRARRLGYKSFVVPEARVWHKVSTSFGGENSPVFQYFLARNRLLWAEKNLSLPRRVVLYKNVLAELVRYFLPPRFRLLGRQNPFSDRVFFSIAEYRKMVTRKFFNPIRKARLLGIRDYLFGRVGGCPDTLTSLRK